MNLDFLFFANSCLLGVGLAMDAFSVSLVSGMNEPNIERKKHFLIAGVFAFFQGLMPLIGWFLIKTLANYFTFFETIIPYVACVVLVGIGSKMMYDAIKSKNEELSNEEKVAKHISFSILIVQGIATSLDALSVGLTISSYNFVSALICALIIALETFIICFVGVLIGRKFGEKLRGKSEILGASILIFIGFEILISSFL